jgi:hypothetical protein
MAALAYSQHHTILISRRLTAAPGRRSEEEQQKVDVSGRQFYQNLK